MLDCSVNKFAFEYYMYKFKGYALINMLGLKMFSLNTAVLHILPINQCLQQMENKVITFCVKFFPHSFQVWFCHQNLWITDLSQEETLLLLLLS